MPDLPSSDRIRDISEDVLSASKYQLETAAPKGALAEIYAQFLQLVEWLLTPFRWLVESLNGFPPILRNLIIVFLCLLLVALATHIVFSVVRAVQVKKRKKVEFKLESELVQDPKVLEDESNRAAQAGDPLLAIRLLFKACLLRISEKQKRPIRKGTTNREHLSNVRGTGFFEPVRTFVVLIDRKWYGDESCGMEDFESCRHAHRQLLVALNPHNV